MIRLTLLLLLFCLLSIANQAQAQVNPKSFPSDTSTTLGGQVDSMEEKTPEKIVPWKRFDRSGHDLITNDSLLRWQIWPNWGDFYAYRNDVISFRQGTVGRIDAYHISGYGPYEQSLDLEGIDLSNAITGLINYNFVPQRKIGSVQESKKGMYYSNVMLKNYHILKPISYLNYDEAIFNYRNLEFMVAQSLTERTNIELSFWDRRDGDNYPRNDVLGNQITAKAYHYLSQNVQIRSLFLRNQFENQEPFGYVVSDPLAFSFSEFGPSANTSFATSNKNRRDFIVGIYHRTDSNSVEDTGFELTLTKDDFDLPFASDTLDWDLRTYRANAFKVWMKDRISARIKLGGSYNNFKTNRNIAKSNWGMLNVSSELNYILSTGYVVFGFGNFKQRNDNSRGSEIGLGISSSAKNINLTLSATLFDRMPTMQEKYWKSINYSGNPDLKNEQGISVFGQVDIHLNQKITVGFSGRWKQSENDAFFHDSTFVNSGKVTGVSGTVFAKFQNHRFELNSSATIDALGETDPDTSLAPLSYNQQKVWLRNNAFIKGYAFQRATFIKLGVRTTLSPLTYGSKLFNTELQYWQANSSQVDLPAFFRMDAELSARVRAIMVVLRWENVLDGFGQAGYFEAATLPMPARRLIVGIRAQFRN